MKINHFIFLLMVFICIGADAKPKTRVEFGYTKDKFARVRIINETNDNLLCYVAIDGYRQKFKLLPNATSKWYQATDKRFTYKSFSTWCDFAKNYPTLP